MAKNKTGSRSSSGVKSKRRRPSTDKARNESRTKKPRSKKADPLVIDDPHAQREARKYGQPIASREYILECLKDANKPLSFLKLTKLLVIPNDDPDQEEALQRRLRAMQRDGQIIQLRRGAYALAEPDELVKGRVSANASGFGFLIPEEGGDDLFLSPGQMKALFDGDIILAKVSGIDRRGRKEGRVEEILERHTHEVVGRVYYESGVHFLKAESKKITQDILLEDDDLSEIDSSQLVVLELTRQPDYRSPAMGKIKEVLGAHMAPGMEIEVAIRSHNLPHLWPHDLERELKSLPNKITKADLEHRVDLRAHAFFTIDGEDARDFDDAICCQRNEDGWALWVAIADVAHYVHSGTALDDEALSRGNSVYFPQRVIPMLPEVLSNGLCSLNPDEDRLTLCCEMRVDTEGELSSYRFMESCIHSQSRLTYTEVAAFLDDGSVSPALEGLCEDIVCFYELFEKLKAKRDERGAINVETTESRFIFNEQKKIDGVVPVVRNVAHQMIEEAMLLANICAANLLNKRELPALYRTHDAPTAEKINDLKEYLQPLGFRFSSSGPDLGPEHFQEAIAFSLGRTDQELINTIVLRSMQQAIYSAECSQHFGLAYEEYAHFTSPIRRYPDLIVHRALKYWIRSKSSTKDVLKVKGVKALTKKAMLIQNEGELLERGQYLSFTERRADLATRDAVDWLKCEFMQDKVGEVFTGKISSVTGFGLFVLLDDIYIEGLVHITDLDDDYYQYDDRRHELVAERSSKVFRLADPLTIRVARVSLDEKKIEFLIEPEEGAEQSFDKLSRVSARPTRKKKPAARLGRKKRGADQETSAEGREEGSAEGKSKKAKVKKAKKKTSKAKAGKSNAGKSKAKPSKKKASADAPKKAKRKPKKKSNAKRRED